MQLADIVAARAKDGKNYGVILLPEGLIEHVPEACLYHAHMRCCTPFSQTVESLCPAWLATSRKLWASAA